MERQTIEVNPEVIEVIELTDSELETVNGGMGFWCQAFTCFYGGSGSGSSAGRGSSGSW